jgi:uncharacterized membrane protein
MKSSILLGRVIFAIGVAALGVQNVIYADFVLGLEPVPSWIPGRLFWAYLTGVLLIAGGAGVVVNKKARWAAISIGFMLFVWVLLLHVPTVAVDPRNGSAWTSAFETLALGGGAWVLAGILAIEPAAGQMVDGAVDKTIKMGRFCFAISLPVFGILHFIYRDYVASVIPAWIPGHMFWAYFTGVAHIAAGVSLVIKVKAYLAATLLGIMFGTWVLILHAPRVAANLHARPEWTSLFVAIAMCGGSLLVAGSLAMEDSTQRVDPRV